MLTDKTYLELKAQLCYVFWYILGLVLQGTMQPLVCKYQAFWTKGPIPYFLKWCNKFQAVV